MYPNPYDNKVFAWWFSSNYDALSDGSDFNIIPMIAAKLIPVQKNVTAFEVLFAAPNA